jgi:glycerate dehydrogenase
MKIVVLDGYALNPGDLTWHDLEALGQCAVYDRTPPEEVVSRAADAEIVLTNKTVLSSELIALLPNLRYIGVLATGYNVVDVEAARARGIAVTNVPAYSSPSVVQLVFAHLLNLTHHVALHAEGVKQGRWSSCPDFCYWERPLIELAGLAMGIVGFGRIGRAVARVALAFGMKVIAYDTVTPADLPVGCEMVELEDVFRRADVVTLHCPLVDETKHLVNKQRLALMKKTAFLINASRGPVVDEEALADALNNEQIAGAGLDVLSAEPPDENNPLLRAKRCYITPHIAWATRAARARLLDTVVENVRAFLDGHPRNVVN